MLRLARKYPVVKTMHTYLILTAGADMIEQFCITKRSLEEYKYDKTLRISFTGGFVIGPLIYNWVRLLEKFIPGRSLKYTVLKVCLDSSMFAPCAISCFYITTNILEGKKDLLAEWRQKFFITWTTGLMYWPIVQSINFAFVPKVYKTSVYLPVCSFIWTNYLCYMKEKSVFKK